MDSRCLFCGAFALCLLYSHVASAADPHDPKHTEDTIEEIVVSISPLERRADELTVPVTSLDRDQILHHVGSSLGETLAREPGIATTGFAAGASRPVIRGQDALRVRVLRDGLGAHDVSELSPDHGVPVNPLVAQRVEVLRGAGTLRYGGGANGGVVSVLTNRVPRLLPEDPIGGEFYSAYGTVARQRDAALLAEGSVGSLAWHFDASSRDSADYKVPDQGPRRQPGSATDGYAIAGGMSYFFERARVGLAYESFANRYGIPESGEEVEIDLDKTAVLFEADIEEPLPGIEKLSFRGNRSVYEHSEFAGGDLGGTFKNDQEEFRLELLHQPFANTEGVLGFSYGNRAFEGLGEAEDFLLPTDTEDLAVFLFEEIELGDRVRVQAAGRASSVQVQGTPAGGARRTERFTPVSGSLGGLVQLADGLSAGLNVAYQERAPAPVELYAAGPHEATETFELGDPDSDEERSLSVDLVLRGEAGPLSAEAGFFYTDYSDYIFAGVTGRRCEEDGTCGAMGELAEIVYAQEDAVFYGGELSGALEVMELAGGHLGIDFQFDVVRARLDQSGNVPRLTPRRFGAGVHFANDRLHARLGALQTSKQRRAGRNESETDGYIFVDSELAIRLAERDERSLELMLSVDNLLDEEARNHLSFRKDDQVLPGRNIQVGLRGTF